MSGSVLSTVELFDQMIAPYADFTRFAASAFKLAADCSFFPRTPVHDTLSAFAECAETVGRHHSKPRFNIDHVMIDDRRVAAEVERVGKTPFANLLHFKRDLPGPAPKLLFVPPMSGHFAAQFAETVRTLSRDHDVYVVDWRDLNHVPLSEGVFDLNDYVTHLVEWAFPLIGERAHLMLVSQSGPPGLAAAALAGPLRPLSVTVIASPIDTRISPTDINDYAKRRSLNWFREHLIGKIKVADGHREVYSGRVQHAGLALAGGFWGQVQAHQDLFHDVASGNKQRADLGRTRFAQGNAAMDLSADYYLGTIKDVFHEPLLAKGEWTWRNPSGQILFAEPHSVTDMALMTVEGKKDGICGLGQTEAAHKIFGSIPHEKRVRYVQPGAGHHGVCIGPIFEKEIYPRLKAFTHAHDRPALLPH